MKIYDRNLKEVVLSGVFESLGKDGSANIRDAEGKLQNIIDGRMRDIDF